MAKEKEIKPVDEAASPPEISFEEPEFLTPEEAAARDAEAQKKKTDEEAALKAAPVAPPVDNASAIVEGIAKLVEKLPSREQAAVPQQQPGESNEAFAKRFAEEFFKDESRMFGSLTEAVQRIVAPMLQQQANLSYDNAEKLMALDPETAPVWKKYKAEIKQFVTGNFPPGMQRNPQVLEYAYKQVFGKHVEEIAQDRANAILEEERKKKPASSAASGEREPFAMEGSAGSSASSRPPRRQIVITEEDMRVAEMKGVDPSVVAARRSR